MNIDVNISDYYFIVLIPNWLIGIFILIVFVLIVGYLIKRKKNHVL